MAAPLGPPFRRKERECWWVLWTELEVAYRPLVRAYAFECYRPDAGQRACACLEGNGLCKAGAIGAHLEGCAVNALVGPGNVHAHALAGVEPTRPEDEERAWPLAIARHDYHVR